jgi:hypothetical protein
VARAGALARQHGPIWRGCGQRTNGLRGSSQSEGEIDGGSQWGNRQDLPPLPAILLRSLASDFRPRRHNVPSLLPACPATEPSFAGNAQSMVLLQWQSSWRCFAACVFTVCGVWTAGDDFGELAAPPVQEQQGPLNVRGRPLASWVTTHQPVRAAMSLRLAPKPTARQPFLRPMRKLSHAQRRYFPAGLKAAIRSPRQPGSASAIPQPRARASGSRQGQSRRGHSFVAYWPKLVASWSQGRDHAGWRRRQEMRLFRGLPTEGFLTTRPKTQGGADHTSRLALR